MIAGVLKSQVKVIPTDKKDFGVQVPLLIKAIEEDISNGKVPCFCSFNIGSTAAGAVDNLKEIGAVCNKYSMLFFNIPDIWLHVDAAYAGSAMVCPEYQYLAEGLEYSNSFVMNPHKWYSLK